LGFVWVIATVLASGFQVARNGLQRSLMPQTGPWGATLVRFLFGLPFSAVFAIVVVTLTPGARPGLVEAFWLTVGLGAASQLLATAALLIAMRRAGFAVGTALQQSSLPLAALIGLWAFHDHLRALAWIGVAVTTGGLALLSWPWKTKGAQPASRPQPVTGALFGLASGLAFGFSLNAFRHAGQALEPHHPIYAAVVTVFVVQAMQSVVLGTILLIWKPQVIAAVLAGARHSWGAGLCGSLASTGWFVALALAPAASVRAVGVVEAPMAAFAGHRLFNEKLHPLQLIAGAAVAVGVLMTAIG
jgi:drug/metabolite transporter (DMT)-like permease